MNDKVGLGLILGLILLGSLFISIGSLSYYFSDAQLDVGNIIQPYPASSWPWWAWAWLITGFVSLAGGINLRKWV